MWMLVLIPFLVQSVVIGLDECHFHLKRGLPKWERIGHPIDTLSVVICFAIALLFPFSSGALKIYIGFAVFSCLLVTKDEFVHKHHCPASEQWLHALLFLNHPIMLSAIGLIWAASTKSTSYVWLREWLDRPALLHLFLIGQSVFTALFFMYQVIFWNFIWKEKKIG